MRQESLYVLRLWRDGESPDAWRYSLRNVRTHEQVSFATLKALCDYIDLQRSREVSQGIMS